MLSLSSHSLSLQSMPFIHAAFTSSITLSSPPSPNKTRTRLSSSPPSPSLFPIFSLSLKKKMSEFCLSSTNKTQFSSLILSDFMLFCSFILSHPLYFSYFIFFSPYLLKLLSFLSPLFITTSLLLLSLLTGFPGFLHSDHHHSVPQLPDQSSKVSFLLTTYNAVLERLRTKIDEENQGFDDHFEELEAYRIVFETTSCIFEVRENSDEALDLKSEENGVSDLVASAVKCSSHEAESEALITSNLVEKPWPQITQPMAGVKTLEGLFQEVEESECTAEKVEEKKVKTQGTESNKVGSKAMSSKIREMVAKFSDGNGRDYTSKVVKNSRKMCVNLDNADNGGEHTSKVTENSRGSAVNLDSADNVGEYTSKAKENSQGLVVNLDSGNYGGKVAENSEDLVANLDSDAYGGDLVANLNSDANGGEYTSKVEENSRNLDANMKSDDNGGVYTSKVIETFPNLGSFGSMRKEKEWKRTLACKLFEERHNVDGGEGMDLLWETYETDSYKCKTKKGKKGGIEYYDDEEDEEEEEVDAQLCCLQALKFSAGKMNLGMGRPNLLRISKALKGIGWLHHVTRNGKKGYN